MDLLSPFFLSSPFFLNLSPFSPHPNPRQWWDRVCIGDEAIDTTCCSIGADTSQLPLQARERAEKENHRFHSLSESDRLAEISHLTRVRKVIIYFIHKLIHALHVIMIISTPPSNLHYVHAGVCVKPT